MATYSYKGTATPRDHMEIVKLGGQFGLQHIRKMTIGEKIAEMANNGDEKAIAACKDNPKYFDATPDEVPSLSSMHDAIAEELLKTDIYLGDGGVEKIPFEYFDENWYIAAEITVSSERSYDGDGYWQPYQAIFSSVSGAIEIIDACYDPEGDEIGCTRAEIHALERRLQSTLDDMLKEIED